MSHGKHLCQAAGFGNAFVRLPIDDINFGQSNRFESKLLIEQYPPRSVARAHPNFKQP